MSLRIHICRDEDHADKVIETERLVLNDPTLAAQILTEPDILVFDYSQDPNHPALANENRVCVLFND
jgi:hypothetical protein